MMELYSQVSPRYKNEKIGYSNLSISGWGCYLCSIAMLAQLDPVQLNALGRSAGNAFTKNGLIYSAKVASLADMLYLGVFNYPHKTEPCIAVTDNYKSKGVPTHFFVYLPDGRIIDPLDKDPKPKKNIYRITQYRLFENVKLSFDVVDQYFRQKEFNSSVWKQLEAIQDLLHKENEYWRSLK